MGIIINQSAKNLLTTYFGFSIGAINTLFLYTHFLTPEYYGLVGFLLSAANLIWPFMAFGVHNTLVKFFSSYNSSEEKEKLLFLVLFMPALMAIVIGILGFGIYDFILDYFSDQNQFVQPYVWMTFVIAVATAYFEVFFSWAKIHYKSVFGNFLKEVFHRLCIAILLILVYLKIISVEDFIYSLAAVFIIRMIVMGFYAGKLHLPKLKLAFPENRSAVFKYSALILVAGSVATVLLDLDKVMIEKFLPIENVAVYGIAVYITSVIAVPSKAMHQITYPLTAILINKKNKIELEALYKKSSLNLLIISGLIFLLILTNLESLYALIPEEYDIPFIILGLLALVKLYDNLLGNINSILFNSDYYRLVLMIGVILAISAFVLNLIFIPEYGLFGAALATFLAFIAYNTSKFFIVLKKFKIHPFSKKTGLSFLLISGMGVLFFFWSFPFHPVIDIVLKSVLLSAGYISVAFWLNLSEDINNLLIKYLRLRQ